MRTQYSAKKNENAYGAPSRFLIPAKQSSSRAR